MIMLRFHAIKRSILILTTLLHRRLVLAGLLWGDFGDWYSVLSCDAGLVSTASFVTDLQILSKAATVLGLDSDAQFWQTAAGKLSQAYHSSAFDKVCICISDI